MKKRDMVKNILFRYGLLHYIRNMDFMILKIAGISFIALMLFVLIIVLVFGFKLI